MFASSSSVTKCVCMHECMYICIFNMFIYVHVHLWVCMCMHICMCILCIKCNIYMYICVCVCCVLRKAIKDVCITCLECTRIKCLLFWTTQDQRCCIPFLCWNKVKKIFFIANHIFIPKDWVGWYYKNKSSHVNLRFWKSPIHGPNLCSGPEPKAFSLDWELDTISFTLSFCCSQFCSSETS